MNDVHTSTCVGFAQIFRLISVILLWSIMDVVTVNPCDWVGENYNIDTRCFYSFKIETQSL